MRSTLLCLGLLSVLSACSSDGGSGSAAAAGDPGSVAKAQSRGRFTAEKKTALGEYGGIPEGFELTPILSCADQQTYDPRARAGDKFVEAQSSASPTSSSSSIVTSVIQTVDAKHMSQKITVSNIQASPAIPGLPAQVQAESNCSITDDANDPLKCGFKYLGWQPPEDDESQVDHCEADYNSNKFAKTTGTVAMGRFQLASGKRVVAQFTHRENSNVDIKCGKGSNKVLMGTGTIINEEVTTRGLVTRDASLCTPTTTLIRKTIFQLEDGRVLSASFDEITEAPQR